jgi:uncharacterized protein with FMN-binding domain
MKRAGWYVVVGAAAGFAGVAGLHGSGHAGPLVLGPAKPAGTGGTASPAASAPAQAGAAGPTAQPASSGPARRATGTVEQYGYGELSVTVTVHGSQVTAVSVPLLRTADQYSQQLAQQVIPMLRSEVLQVHSARISGISGATYTSVAYAQSIQSALDKLHVR